MRPLRAASRAWAELTGVEIVWQARSLRDFGDQPLEELAESFDLLSIDHPFAGSASATGCLAPLDELLPAEVLEQLAQDSVGPSHESYSFAGHQWGLATDAACQVSVVRDDLLHGRDVPTTWEDVIDMARALPGRVALPLAPADAICCYLTLLANAGAPAPDSTERFAEPGAGVRATTILAELVHLGFPRSLETTPPALLDRMTETSEIVYVPLAFGYTDYARPGERPVRVRFVDIPSAGTGPIGSTLGGSGLAVSASSRRQDEAAAFAAWVTSAEVQRSIVAPSGGQPGSRTAWLDPAVDLVTGGFTHGTLATIEAAYVRPRDEWWPPFQLAAGETLNALLRANAAPEHVYERIEDCYVRAVTR